MRILGPVGTLRTVPGSRSVPAGPDLLTLGIEEPDGTFITSLGALDGRCLSTEVAGGFTARVIAAGAY